MLIFVKISFVTL